MPVSMMNAAMPTMMRLRRRRRFARALAVRGSFGSLGPRPPPDAVPGPPSRMSGSPKSPTGADARTLARPTVARPVTPAAPDPETPAEPGPDAPPSPEAPPAPGTEARPVIEPD